jgi:hypothetical protein
MNPIVRNDARIGGIWGKKKLEDCHVHQLLAVGN